MYVYSMCVYSMMYVLCYVVYVYSVLCTVLLYTVLLCMYYRVYMYVCSRGLYIHTTYNSNNSICIYIYSMYVCGICVLYMCVCMCVVTRYSYVLSCVVQRVGVRQNVVGRGVLAQA